MSFYNAQFRRWRVPGIGKGAIGDNGCGHHKVFGVTYIWHTLEHIGWNLTKSLCLWNLLKITYGDDKGGTLKCCKPGWRVEMARLRIEMRRVY